MLLCFFSSELGQDFLAKRLENSIPIVNPLDYPNIKNVVVMGNGLAFSSNRPANAKLSTIAVTRLVEGVRVFNLTQADNIFFTGLNFADHSLSIAAIMKQSAVDLGVDETKIITIDNSRNSREEARYLSEYLKGDTIFLVSSAAHLKRAAINFENAGIFVIPMPTDYQKNNKKKKTLLCLLPNYNCLANSEKSLHEYRGLLWEKVRKIRNFGK
jgi:uncharacterized SAM-binding protein YcdF (DUF218 family)